MEKQPSSLVPLHWFGFGYTALVASGGIIGYAKAGTTSGNLAGIMGMIFYNSGKFMPAGLIAGASLLMVARVGISMIA
ncbi:transmembrane protein 14C-like [Echinops telfairi]|uniref:Transmembrane protein 14C n=1 Tax=Echinops telfairi TaxID=9371 RepID=A0ABM1VMF3_ECHTE|nr:transmembrane protein 14C-like [Echinops telfairi]